MKVYVVHDYHEEVQVFKKRTEAIKFIKLQGYVQQSRNIFIDPNQLDEDGEVEPIQEYTIVITETELR